MTNPILDTIRALFKPATELIDDLTTSKEEKMAGQATFMRLETEVLALTIGYEQRLAEMRAQIITAEAQSDSWLTKNWRPLVMVTFLFIIVNNTVLTSYVGAPQLEVPADIWTVIKIGLAGYIPGRSLEKIVKMRNGKK